MHNTTEDNRLKWWKDFKETINSIYDEIKVVPSTESHLIFATGMTGVEIHSIVSLGKRKQYAQCCVYIKKESKEFRDFILSQEIKIFEQLGVTYEWREPRGYDTRVAEIIPDVKGITEFNMNNPLEYDNAVNWQARVASRLYFVFSQLVKEYKNTK